MISFVATIVKYIHNGEKSGWHHIVIPSEVIALLHLPNKKSFYVHGHIDGNAISRQAVFPVGNNTFIIPIKKQLLLKLQKHVGAEVAVAIAIDSTKYEINKLLIEALSHNTAAYLRFETIKPAEQRYWSKYIDDGKTDATKHTRLTKIVYALEEGMSYPEMLKIKI